MVDNYYPDKDSTMFPAGIEEIPSGKPLEEYIKLAIPLLKADPSLVLVLAPEDDPSAVDFLVNGAQSYFARIPSEGNGRNLNLHVLSVSSYSPPPLPGNSALSNSTGIPRSLEGWNAIGKMVGEAGVWKQVAFMADVSLGSAGVRYLGQDAIGEFAAGLAEVLKTGEIANIFAVFTTALPANFILSSDPRFSDLNPQLVLMAIGHRNSSDKVLKISSRNGGEVHIGIIAHASSGAKNSEYAGCLASIRDRLSRNGDFAEA